MGKSIVFINGLGEHREEKVLAEFQFNGETWFVVLDRARKPTFQREKDCINEPNDWIIDFEC